MRCKACWIGPPLIWTEGVSHIPGKAPHQAKLQAHPSLIVAGLVQPAVVVESGRLPARSCPWHNAFQLTAQAFSSMPRSIPILNIFKMPCSTSIKSQRDKYSITFVRCYAFQACCAIKSLLAVLKTYLRMPRMHFLEYCIIYPETMK